MKKITLAVVIFLAAVVPAKAEVFQFVDNQSNSYLVYRAVWQFDALLGYTDGYGRLRLDSPTGTLSITLKYGNLPDKPASITVTGAQELKLVRVE